MSRMSSWLTRRSIRKFNASEYGRGGFRPTSIMDLVAMPYQPTVEKVGVHFGIDGCHLYELRKPDARYCLGQPEHVEQFSSRLLPAQDKIPSGLVVLGIPIKKRQPCNVT